MKVLVPVDGSENSLRACEYVANWMKADQEVRTTLVHVTHLVSWTAVTGMAGKIGISDDFYQELLARDAQPYLDQAAELFAKKGLVVETKLIDTEKDTAEEIASYAKKENIEYIVMGRRGLGTVKGLILGSISRKVLYLTEIPVILIK